MILNTDTAVGIKCDGFIVSYGDKERGYDGGKIEYDYVYIGGVFTETKMGIETGYENVNVGFTYGGIEFGCIG